MEDEKRKTVIHVSLVKYRQISGVEAELAILNGTICIAVTLGYHLLWFPVISMFMHFLLRRVSQHDPNMRRVYLNFNRQKVIYDSW